MAVFNREDSRTVLPQMEKAIQSEASIINVDTEARSGTVDGNLMDAVRSLGYDDAIIRGQMAIDKNMLLSYLFSDFVYIRLTDAELTALETALGI